MVHVAAGAADYAATRLVLGQLIDYVAYPLFYINTTIVFEDALKLPVILIFDVCPLIPIDKFIKLRVYGKVN